MSETLAERFYKYVDEHGPIMPKMTTPCHVWTGGKNKKGYGWFHMGSRRDGTKRPQLAHRVAFFIVHGRWPKNALHRCDNSPCVREDHLFEGTKGDNNRDMAAKGRASRGESHCHAKLTEAEVLAIRFEEGTHQEIGARHGISKTQVGNIKLGKTWAHVKG
jgi:HNH endonuclease